MRSYSGTLNGFFSWSTDHLCGGEWMKQKARHEGAWGTHRALRDGQRVGIGPSDLQATRQGMVMFRAIPGMGRLTQSEPASMTGVW